MLEKQEKIMDYRKELFQKYETDVFVVGGGAAGVAAAVAAARGGKSVYLAETLGCFGGLGTSGLVPAFATFSDGERLIADGIGLEIRKNVSKDQPLDARWGRIDAEELKREYDRIMTEAGVRFSFFTTLYDVVTSGDRVDYVILGSKSGLFCVKAKIYIDCSGDGDLCAYAGADFEIGNENGEVMPQTLCTTWCNVDLDRLERVAHNTYIEEAYANGILSQEDRHLPGMFCRTGGIGGGNLGHTFGIDPLDEASLTAAMIKGRQQAVEYGNYYRTYFKGYENARLCATASILGVRESRRIVCDYMLGVEDFRNRAVFEDEIGRYCYPVDIHVMSTDKEEYDRFQQEYKKNLRYGVGESYGIPYRCLIPKKLSNVLVAGRCVGSDRQMQASVRVMPGCFLTGQAAGAAAALATESENVRSISVSELKGALQALGAYLPNA